MEQFSIEEEIQQKLEDRQTLLDETETLAEPAPFLNEIKRTVWEQFLVSLGLGAGDSFIDKNKGMTMDLRSSSHIQNSQDSANGKFATHNRSVDYKARYEQHEKAFTTNSKGERIMDKSYRLKVIDAGRPKGDGQFALDHTIPVAEMWKDDVAATYMSESEMVAFANDTDVNLKPLDALANQSKGRRAMRDWLNSLRNGKTPDERFDIDKEELLERDDHAREEWAKKKLEAEERNIELGKQSQREEALDFLDETGKAVFFALLSKFGSAMLGTTVSWLKEKPRNINNLLEGYQGATIAFAKDIKGNLRITADVSITSLGSALFGPIFAYIRRLFLIIIAGGKCVFEVRRYLKAPENEDKDPTLKTLEISRIITPTMMRFGGEALSMSITFALRRFAPWLDNVTLLMLGKPSNIIASFTGTLLSGIGGAIALFQINAKTTSYLVNQNLLSLRSIDYEILCLQDQLYQQDRFETLQIETKVMKQAEQRKEDASTRRIVSPLSDNHHKQREQAISKMQKALGA